MKRMIGFLALGLGGIGLVACLAGLIALWVVRAPVLRSSTEVFDAAGDGLKLVDEKAKRADELVGKVREIVEPVTSKIIKLADKAERTLEDEKELKRMEADLTQRLRQVDTIAETAETAVAFLNKTSRLTGLLRLPTSHNATGQSAAQGSQNSSDALSRLAKKLATLRENLAKFREDKQVQQETVDIVVRLARDVDKELKLVGSQLQRVRQKTAEFEAEVAELRTTVPAWMNWTAVVGSVILVWMGVGQLALMRRGWAGIREGRPA